MSSVSRPPSRGALLSSRDRTLVFPAAVSCWGGPGLDQVQHSRVVQPRAKGAFEGGVDLGEQATDPVAGGGDLPGEVIVEAGQHGELGDRLVVEFQRPQGVRHRPCGLGDHGGVAGICLGRTRVQVGDPSHRQARQIGHRDALVQRDRDR